MLITVVEPGEVFYMFNRGELTAWVTTKDGIMRVHDVVGVMQAEKTEDKKMLNDLAYGAVGELPPMPSLSSKDKRV
jgi:hypothetical protein